MLLSYYKDAVVRSSSAAWEWAAGQGILLTWLFAVGVVVAAALYAIIRAWQKHHSWSQAVGDVKKAIRDFVIAALGGTLVVLVLLFAVFFIRDAPTEMIALSGRVTSLESSNKALQSKFNELSDRVTNGYSYFQQGGPTGRLVDPYQTTVIIQTSIQRSPVSAIIEFDHAPSRANWVFANEVPLFCRGTSSTITRDQSQSLDGNKFTLSFTQPYFEPLIPLFIQVTGQEPMSVKSVHLQ